MPAGGKNALAVQLESDTAHLSHRDEAILMHRLPHDEVDLTSEWLGRIGIVRPNSHLLQALDWSYEWNFNACWRSQPSKRAREAQAEHHDADLPDLALVG
ncbi:MAG: hypothetical protein AB8G96_15245 [Phycisphaerales bacterium]